MLEPYLMEHPLFKWLDSRHIAFLAAHAEQKQFGPDETMLSAGGEADCFYVIVHGEVAITSPHDGGETTTVQTLSDGDVLGWSWLVPPHVWQFGARALTPTSALALDARSIRCKCEEDHDMGYELMRRFSSIMLERLHAFRRANGSTARQTA